MSAVAKVQVGVGVRLWILMIVLRLIGIVVECSDRIVTETQGLPMQHQPLIGQLRRLEAIQRALCGHLQ